MNPSPKRYAVVVGLFITFAIAIFAGGILAVGNLNDTFTRTITVSAVFNEVSGLQKGDNIWFSGLKVGTVSRLAFEGDAKVRVELKIDEAAAPHIHTDALAKIGSDGLIGNRIVVIYAGSPEERAIQDGDVLAIGETVSTEALMTMLQTNNQNLLAITTDLKAISHKIANGEGTIGRLVQEDDLYVRVNDTVTALDASAANAQELTQSLASFSAELDRDGSLPKDLVTDRTTYASLIHTVSQLERAGDRLAEVADRLAVASENRETPLGTVLHDEAVGAKLESTLENLNRSTVLLNEDLEALQHNFLLRGYFRRQERAAEEAAEPK